MYYLEMIIKHVTKFNEESQDWSGEADAFPIDNMRIELSELNKKKLVTAIGELLYTNEEIKESDLFINDEFISINVVENEEGVEDENGKYLADYTFCIVEENLITFEGFKTA